MILFTAWVIFHFLSTVAECLSFCCISHILKHIPCRSSYIYLIKIRIKKIAWWMSIRLLLMKPVWCCFVELVLSNTHPRIRLPPGEPASSNFAISSFQHAFSHQITSWGTCIVKFCDWFFSIRALEERQEKQTIHEIVESKHLVLVSGLTWETIMPRLCEKRHSFI